MLRRFLVIALLLMSCATRTGAPIEAPAVIRTNYERLKAALLGEDVSEIYPVLGAPTTEVLMPNGHTLYEWERAWPPKYCRIRVTADEKNRIRTFNWTEGCP